jgi:hypothetical protein
MAPLSRLGDSQGPVTRDAPGSREGVEQGARLLGVAVGQQFHRALQVGEEYGDEFAFSLKRRFGRQDLLGEVGMTSGGAEGEGKVDSTPVMSRPSVNSPFNLAANSNALRAVRGVVKAARTILIAPCRVASSKIPASAATITCWSRSVNLGALGRPCGLPD